MNRTTQLNQTPLQHERLFYKQTWGLNISSDRYTCCGFHHSSKLLMSLIVLIPCYECTRFFIYFTHYYGRTGQTLSVYRVEPVISHIAGHKTTEAATNRNWHNTALTVTITRSDALVMSVAVAATATVGRPARHTAI